MVPTADHQPLKDGVISNAIQANTSASERDKNLSESPQVNATVKQLMPYFQFFFCARDPVMRLTS